MSKRVFEIGLVGAGAVSAGAYTGGVIDFMIYALDKWYAAKLSNVEEQRIPPHDVKLSVFSGASAGGITAALGAAYLGSDQPSIIDEKCAYINKGKNKLFDCWVDRIDIASLLESRDLQDKQSPVISLLDSSILSEIADSGLDIAPRTTRRPYIAENFELLLTVTNLRGVPYAFTMQGDKPKHYNMSLHADYMHFCISDSNDRCLSDRYTMCWADFGNPLSPIKQKIKVAALASGAFPIGLAPRILDHTLSQDKQKACDIYSSRLWSIPTYEDQKSHRCITYETIPVNWPLLPHEYRFEFQCVDGGVMNNEPLELARQILKGSEQRNPRLGKAADKAVLLIDPFPSNTSFDNSYTTATDILNTILKLFGALKNQARFKPDELILAIKEDVYSRFMIAPSRDGKTHSIACGALGGFGGFLKRDFRSHDYFLGRRNAQKFFRDHFVLPENNPLFEQWDEDTRDQYCIRNNGQPIFENGCRLLPIIPLVGDAKNECLMVEWPKYTQKDLEQLLKQLESRVNIVLDRLVNQYFKSNNPVVRFVAKIVVGRKKKDIVDYIKQKVIVDLKKMELYEIK